MYASARLCPYVCACTCVTVCAHVEGKGQHSVVSLNCSGSCVQEQSPSINPPLINWVGWLPGRAQDSPVPTSHVGLQAHTAKLSFDESHRFSARYLRSRQPRTLGKWPHTSELSCTTVLLPQAPQSAETTHLALRLLPLETPLHLSPSVPFLQTPSSIFLSQCWSAFPML